jgi:replicative DNA helicase
MSDGKKLVAAILGAGSVETLRIVSDDLFEDEELAVFRFVKTHFRRYGELPNARTVEQETRERLPSAPESVDYYLKRLHDRRLFVALRDDFGRLRDALQGFNVEQAKEVIDRMKSSCRVSTPDNDLRNVREAADLVLQQYNEAHMNPGLSGIPTGWAHIDEATGGYQRGDLVAWIARMGIGKTYLLLAQALNAWKAGYNVLFVTMEMTVEQIARRAIGMDVGINPDHIRKGALDPWRTRHLQRYIQTLRNFDRFHIYAGSFSKKVSDLDVLIHELAPDIVYVDSAYRMQPDSASRSAGRLERVALAYDDLKKLTITSDRPMITTSQFNRQAGQRGKAGTLESVSFSDAIAMHASLVFGIKEGTNPHQRTRREIEIMKGREGEGGIYEVNYRFAPMDFSYIEKEENRQAEPGNPDWMLVES